MSVREKIACNMTAYRYLRGRTGSIVMQRCHYHSFAPLLAAMYPQRPLILDLDDWEARDDTSAVFGMIPRSKAQMLMRYSARHSIFCVAASRFLADYLRQYNERTLYVPTGVDTNVFCPHQAPLHPAPVFSWLGTMHRADNVENIAFLIDCFVAVRREIPQVRLEICGGGAYEQDVRRLAEGHCDAGVVFRPWLAPDRVPAYLAAVDVGVMPLIQETKFNQAKSPTRLFEYMAMAKPVIASAVGEAAHIIKDGVTGCLARSKEDFVRAMRALCQSDTARHAMGAQARKTAEQSLHIDVVCREFVREIGRL